MICIIYIDIYIFFLVKCLVSRSVPCLISRCVPDLEEFGDE